MSDFAPLDHTQTQDLFSDFLEQSLSPEAQARFMDHLKGCPNCEHSLEQFSEAMALVREAPRNTAPAAATIDWENWGPSKLQREADAKWRPLPNRQGVQRFVDWYRGYYGV